MVIDFYIIPIFILVIFTCYVFRDPNYLHAFWHLPGPFKFPLLGNLYLFSGHLSDILGRLVELTIQFNGQIALWAGPKLNFIVTHPDHLKILFTSHHCLDHATQYEVFKPAFGDGVFTANGQKWKTARKMCNAAFHPNIVRKFVDKYHKHSNIMIKLIRKEVGKGDFLSYPYIRNCTFDIILDTQFEYSNFNCQYQPRKEIDDVDSQMDLLFHRIFKFWEKPEWFFKIIPVGRYFEKCFDAMSKMHYRIVEEKRRDYEKRKNKNEGNQEKLFIQHLLELKELTPTEITHHVTTIIVTGYETTANTLGFIFLMLGLHQDVQDKVFEEDRDIQEKLNYREPDADDLNLYVYLEQVIKETLRLFPVGPTMAREAKENIQIGEYFVPAGSNIIALLFLTHRRPDLFKDPMVFNPENFSPENIEKRHPYAFLPFSAGPRNCVGMKYAWMVMKVIVSKIVRNFRIIANQQIKDIDIKVETTLKNPEGYRIRLENR